MISFIVFTSLSGSSDQIQITLRFENVSKNEHLRITNNRVKIRISKITIVEEQLIIISHEKIPR